MIINKTVMATNTDSIMINVLCFSLVVETLLDMTGEEVADDWVTAVFSIVATKGEVAVMTCRYLICLIKMVLTYTGSC